MRTPFICLLLVLACLPACEPMPPSNPPGDMETEGEMPAEGEASVEGEAPAEGEPTGPAEAVFYDYAVVNVYPHDDRAFTQGLQYVDGFLYEGTGLRNGRSSLRRVVLESGEVLQQINLDDQYFGEGIVVLDDEIIQLTWQSQVAFVYDRDTFEKTGEFRYETEGWGITYDGERLIMSDGTSQLYFRDPDTFQITRTLRVVDGDQPVTRLNELEYINGEVYANVWRTDFVAIIDPHSGLVAGWIDLSGLLDTTNAKVPDVLNGIAYDESANRLFVTGKLWPRLYEIELIPRTG